MLIATDVLSEVLVFVFAAEQSASSSARSRRCGLAERLRIQWQRYWLIWVPEAAAALGLLAGFASAPLGAAAAIGLVLLMAGALSFRLRMRDSVAFLLGDGVLLALAATTAALRITSG